MGGYGVKVAEGEEAGTEEEAEKATAKSYRMEKKQSRRMVSKAKGGRGWREEGRVSGLGLRRWR